MIRSLNPSSMVATASRLLGLSSTMRSAASAGAARASPLASPSEATRSARHSGSSTSPIPLTSASQTARSVLAQPDPHHRENLIDVDRLGRVVRRAGLDALLAV